MKHLVYFLIIFLFVQCRNVHDRGGVVFTFDDQSVDEWVNHRGLFESYNIRATFFISHPKTLDSMMINGLQLLASDGHEIACHGLHHVSVLNFADSPDVYLKKEVLPAVNILEGFGFDIRSFAYPFGESTPQADSLLLGHFEYLRKATWNMDDTTIDAYDDIFVNEHSYKVMNSMGIDYNYRISLENLETGIRRARRNNEVLVLHAHKIDTIPEDYIIHPDYLEQAFQLINKYNIASLRVTDIAGFFEHAIDP